MKKVFLSLPMSGRTQENIEFTIKAMTKKAKEILGEDIEVSHLGDLKKYDNMDILANPGMFNMVHATSKMIHCDYFMGFSRAALNLLGVITHSKHKGCIMEEELWHYSQRHNSNKIININGKYICNNRLSMIQWNEISKFVPELDTKEKVQAAKQLLGSSYGMRGGMHIAYVPEDFAAEVARKKNHIIALSVHGARSKVATIDDVVDDGKEEKDRFVLGEIKSIELNKEDSNGKEENN